MQARISEKSLFYWVIAEIIPSLLVNTVCSFLSRNAQLMELYELNTLISTRTWLKKRSRDPSEWPRERESQCMKLSELIFCVSVLPWIISTKRKEWVLNSNTVYPSSLDLGYLRIHSVITPLTLPSIANILASCCSILASLRTNSQKWWLTVFKEKWISELKERWSPRRSSLSWFKVVICLKTALFTERWDSTRT